MWYASSPGHRTLQLAGDLGLLLWCFGWIVAGSWVHRLILALAEPAIRLRSAGTSFDVLMRGQGDRLLDLPLVGDRIRDAFHAAAGPGADVAAAGADLARILGQLAVGLGITTALAPILLAALPWLWWRIRFARRARAAARLVGAGAGLDLFALRALTGRSVVSLSRVGADPCRGWRDGDPATIRALAALELRACGLSGAAAGLDRAR